METSVSINDSDIKDFQELYLRFIGKQITAKEARLKLFSLIESVHAACQPVTHQQLVELWTKDEYEDKKHEPLRPASSI